MPSVLCIPCRCDLTRKDEGSQHADFGVCETVCIDLHTLCHQAIVKVACWWSVKPLAIVFRKSPRNQAYTEPDNLLLFLPICTENRKKCKAPGRRHLTHAFKLPGSCAELCFVHVGLLNFAALLCAACTCVFLWDFAQTLLIQLSELSALMTLQT